VDVEALGHRGERAPDLLQHSVEIAPVSPRRGVVVGRGLEAGPAAVEPVGLVRLVALRARLELGVELARQSAFIFSTSPR
jgi:hypothetical protein